jgi:hypothetical protein
MSDLTVGATFAGCRLDAVAGRGGMGIVYRATQLALGRQVALKAMTPDLAEDADYRERFQRESHIAASIDHPNVIPVYEAGEMEGTLYLLMRWVEGTDLRTLLRSSERLSPARAVRLLRPVASALAAAHRRGLVHRDIKPANVLIAGGEEEHVYLTDFGIARRTEGEAAMTRTGVFVGTVDYSAPERLEGSHGDASSDIYSFGCMLYETVSGHVPYERPSEISKIFAHINDPVPSLRAELGDVPAPLDAIVLKAMAKRPEDRFGSAAELAGVLGDLLQDLDTHELELRRQAQAHTAVRSPTAATTEVAPPAAAALPVTEARTAVGQPRRRRSLLAVPLVLAAVIVAVLIAVLSGGGSSGTPQARTVGGAGISVVRTLDLGGAAGGLTVGPTGAIWASVPSDGAVIRVGPRGKGKSFAVGGHPGAVTAGPGGIWVAGSMAGSLARFNLADGARVATAKLSDVPTALAIDSGDGSVWAAGAGVAVTHVASDGAVIGSPVQAGSAPKGIGVGEGWVWVVNGSQPGLFRVPTRGGPARAFDGGPGPVSVGFDSGVWMANANGHVTRFDPRPQVLHVVADVRLGTQPLDAVAAVEGRAAVWALSRQARTVYRISRETQRVSGQMAFASAPVALVLSGRYAWVATEDGKLIQLLA